MPLLVWRGPGLLGSTRRWDWLRVEMPGRMLSGNTEPVREPALLAARAAERRKRAGRAPGALQWPGAPPWPVPSPDGHRSLPPVVEWRALCCAGSGSPEGLSHRRAGGGSQTRAECDTYLPAPGSTAPAAGPARGCAAGPWAEGRRAERRVWGEGEEGRDRSAPRRTQSLLSVSACPRTPLRRLCGSDAG